MTILELRPTLQKQRDDAERKGQVARQKIFDGLLTRLGTQPQTGCCAGGIRRVS